jgi:hypothetical protein
MTKQPPELSDSKGLRVRRFFELEARTLEANYKIIETLLPNSVNAGAAHPAEEGRHIESILRSFLNRHLPANLKAVSGFILCPSTKTGRSDLTRVQEFDDRHSTQLDIIVYDFDAYPVYERFEEFCIVPPEGVIGVISVKKTLYGSSVESELRALRAVAELCEHKNRRGPFTGLFAFSAEAKTDTSLNETVFSKIKAVHEDDRFDCMVNEVSVLSRTVVFKIRSEDSPPKFARYVGVDCREAAHIPLQRMLNSLLSVYYDPTRGNHRERPGFVSFEKETFGKSPRLGDVRYRAL